MTRAFPPSLDCYDDNNAGPGMGCCENSNCTHLEGQPCHKSGPSSGGHCLKIPPYFNVDNKSCCCGESSEGGGEPTACNNGDEDCIDACGKIDVISRDCYGRYPTCHEYSEAEVKWVQNNAPNGLDNFSCSAPSKKNKKHKKHKRPTPTTNTNTNTKSQPNPLGGKHPGEGLHGGALAAVIVGSVAGVGLIIAIILTALGSKGKKGKKGKRK